MYLRKDEFPLAENHCETKGGQVQVSKKYGDTQVYEESFPSTDSSLAVSSPLSSVVHLIGNLLGVLEHSVAPEHCGKPSCLLAFVRVLLDAFALQVKDQRKER